jgi:predicted phosphoribosyltransferase
LIAGEADAVVYLGAARNFGAVGAYYREFGQLGEEDVARLLRAAMERTSAAARASK